MNADECGSKTTCLSALTGVHRRLNLAGCLLATAIAPLLCAQPPAPPPVFGAIRWDAWHGNRGVPGRAVETSLGPARWRHRLPFFAKVVSSTEVSIDGASQEVMDREIGYAARAGLGYWAFVRYDANDPMSLGLRHYLASRHRGDIDFCLIVEHHRLGAPSAYRQRADEIARQMAERGYQKVAGGRPLLYIAFLNAAGMEAWGGAKGYAKVVDALRGAARRSGAGNPYIVAMRPGAEAAAALCRDIGADAVGAYALQAGGADAPYSALAAHAEQFWERAKAAGAHVVPTVMSGWDRRPRVLHPVPWEKSQVAGQGIEKFYHAPRPEELAAHARRALQWIEANPGAAPARAALIYAWNENDEGGWLVPTLGEGTARIDALAGVLKP